MDRNGKVNNMDMETAFSAILAEPMEPGKKRHLSGLILLQ